MASPSALLAVGNETPLRLLCNHLSLCGVFVVFANKLVTARSEWTEAHQALRFATYHLFDL